MAKIVFTQSEFFDFVPLLLLTGLKNDDLIDPDSPVFDILDDIEKKVMPKLRQYYLKTDPELRRKLKFLINGFESGNNTITIRGDNAKESREMKYLKESNWQPIEKIISKYMRLSK